MNNILGDLEPKAVWRIFEEMCNIRDHLSLRMKSRNLLLTSAKISDLKRLKTRWVM